MDSWGVKIASSRRKTNLKKEKYTHLLGDQEHAALRMVTLGKRVLLRKTNDGLVSFRKGLAPAAGDSWCPSGRQEMLVELVALYLVLLFLYPETVLFLTGLFVLVIASAF